MAICPHSPKNIVKSIGYDFKLRIEHFRKIDMTTLPEPTLHERKIIYQARRGLKELDFYIDPYVREHYLWADEHEKQAFERLLGYEDPDLLLFFLGQAQCDDRAVGELIDKLKANQHDNQNGA